MDCIKCEHFYYDSGGGGQCDASYEDACLRAHHYFHTHPEKFIKEYLNVKLYPWQKIALKQFLKEGKNTNVRAASRYISQR